MSVKRAPERPSRSSRTFPPFHPAITARRSLLPRPPRNGGAAPASPILTGVTISSRGGSACRQQRRKCQRRQKQSRALAGWHGCFGGCAQRALVDYGESSGAVARSKVGPGKPFRKGASVRLGRGMTRGGCSLGSTAAGRPRTCAELRREAEADPPRPMQKAKAPRKFAPAKFTGLNYKHPSKHSYSPFHCNPKHHFACFRVSSDPWDICLGPATLRTVCWSLKAFCKLSTTIMHLAGDSWVGPCGEAQRFATSGGK